MKNQTEVPECLAIQPGEPWDINGLAFLVTSGTIARQAGIHRLRVHRLLAEAKLLPDIIVKAGDKELAAFNPDRADAIRAALLEADPLAALRRVVSPTGWKPEALQTLFGESTDAGEA